MEFAILISAVLASIVGIPTYVAFKREQGNQLPGGGSPAQLASGLPEPEYELAEDYNVIPMFLPDPQWGLTPAPFKLSPKRKPADDCSRPAKEALGAVASAAPPVRNRKAALDAQVSSFEKCHGELCTDLKEFFSETSLTYDVHARAVVVASERFWENVRIASIDLLRFDATAYADLEKELAKSERIMVDSSDFRTLADQVGSAIRDMGVEFEADELAEIEAKIECAHNAIQQGKYLESRELLKSVKRATFAKIRKSNPIYIEMAEMESELSAVDDFISQNAEMIEQFKRLSSEIRQMTIDDQNGKSNDIIDELTRLSENVHLYVKPFRQRP